MIRRRAAGQVPFAFAAWACAACLQFQQASAEVAQQMLFNPLGNEAGLSQGRVMAIAQDASGYLWLGTEDGLNRYDGSELLHFLRDRKDPATLPNNWISSLATDKDGRLWIGTDGGGVVWKGPGETLFRPPVNAAGQALTDPQGRVRFVKPDPDGQVWIGTRNNGLKLIELDGGTTREFRHDPTDPASLSDDSVFAIAREKNGLVWIGTQSGLDRLDPATGRIMPFGSRLRELTGAAAQTVPVTALHIDGRGTLWAGTPEGLARFDKPSNRIDLLRHREGDAGSLPDNHVNVIFEDDEQRLWVGTADGLGLLDRRTDLFTTFRHDPADASSLPDSHVMEIYQDRSGLLWIGTKSRGAASWNPRSWSFGHRRLGTAGADNVSSFAEDSRGTLWIGSYGAGLSSVDRQSGRVTTWAHKPGDPHSLGDNFIMALVVDRRDRVWLGTMNAGLERLDPATGRIKRFPAGGGRPGAIAARGVMSLLEDSRGRIWVGTYGGGLCMIDAATDAVNCYPVQHGDAPGLSSDRATSLAEDRAGLIWIGTDGGGLNALDPSSGRIAHFQHAQDDAASLSANTVYSVHVDERGRLWVGTRGGGLDRVDGAPFAQQSLQFQNYSESQGLPNSTVYGIESDAGGALWMSTNRGLARFNPETESFQVFRRSHGLQGDEFNFGAHYRSVSGEMFFGGAAGYNAFYPERLRFNERPPQVVLTQFLKFNEPAKIGSNAEGQPEVDLDYRDDVITFRYAALDFSAPAENRYAYMLEGFDRDWVDAGNARQATYTNLDGGHYVFRVKAANSDGRWNDDGVALPIVVGQPLWLRWWAYLLYVAAAALAMYAIWAAQQRKLEREAAYARRLEEEVAARTNEIANRNEQLQQVNNALKEASVTDPLTGLGNRRCLREVVQEMLPSSPKGGSLAASPRFVLMIVDLDHLKPINDQYGHDGGDRVLIQIAEILRQLCRTTDRIVRWGGDEFVVLCRDADLDSAAILAERIRSTVAKRIFRVDEGAVARSSCSIGFAPYPFIAEAPTNVSWEQSLSLADCALYQAKEYRNTWVGWAGKARAAGMPQLLEAVETESARLEAEGYLEVRRQPPIGDDTVDRLRALRGPGDR